MPSCSASLDDGWGLSDSACQRLAAADLVIGAGRTLDLVRPPRRRPPNAATWTGKLGQVPAWILAAVIRESTTSSPWPPATPVPRHRLWLTGKLGPRASPSSRPYRPCNWLRPFQDRLAGCGDCHLPHRRCRRMVRRRHAAARPLQADAQHRPAPRVALFTRPETRRTAWPGR